MSNSVIVNFSDDRELCCSYGVPVAGFIPGRGYVKSAARYSVTTSRHANAYLPYGIADRVEIPDAEFRALFPEIHKAVCG